MEAISRPITLLALRTSMPAGLKRYARRKALGRPMSAPQSSRSIPARLCLPMNCRSDDRRGRAAPPHLCACSLLPRAVPAGRRRLSAGETLPQHQPSCSRRRLRTPKSTMSSPLARRPGPSRQRSGAPLPHPACPRPAHTQLTCRPRPPCAPLAHHRLSRNRQAKRATTDVTLYNHLSTLYHMNRRSCEMYAKSDMAPQPAQQQQRQRQQQQQQQQCRHEQERQRQGWGQGPSTNAQTAASYRCVSCVALQGRLHLLL